MKLSKNINKKNILVIGANGYLGSFLAFKLINQGYKVTCVSKSKSKIFSESICLIGDSCDPNFLQDYIPHNDIIYFLSGNTSIRSAEKNPLENLRTTFSPLINIIEAAKIHNLRPRVIFASTATVYGMTPNIPVDESTLPNPITVYDLHKLFAEQLLEYATREGYIEGISLRLSNVFGHSWNTSSSKDRGFLNRAVSDAINGRDLTLFGSGEVTRDYIFISDVVEAMIKVGFMQDLTRGVFNVGSGKGTTISGALQMIVNLIKIKTGKSIVIQQKQWPIETPLIDHRNFTADVSKLRSMSDWEPKVTIEDGIDLMLDIELKKFS